jgi:hypothetical protein
MELSGTESCLVDKIWPPEIDRHGGSTFGSASSGRPPAPLDLWVRVLVERIAGTTAAPAARRDAVDMIFSLKSFAMFAMLHRDRPVDDVCALVKTACRSALDPLLPDRRRSSRS